MDKQTFGSNSKGSLGLADRFSQFIVISTQPFTRRNLDRFGATWLRNAGKTVHLVDLSLVIWGEHGLRAGEPDATEGVLRPVSWGGFEEFVCKHASDSLALLHVGPRNVVSLLELISRYPVSTLYFQSGCTPAGGRRGRGIGTIVRSLGSHSKRLLKRPFEKIQRPPRAKFALDYFIMSDLHCEFNPPIWLNGAGTIVPAHSYDYAIWGSSDPFIHAAPYIVFLDQAYPDHSDPRILRVANPFKREAYYPTIESFLQQVSAVFVMPVLVALHPRSSPGDGPAPYQGFQTFRERTASLVKGASLVVAHDTTAISFAVLGRKPLLLVRLDEMARWLAGYTVDAFAHGLGAHVAHINTRGLPALDSLKANESKYASFEAMYIRHPECNGIHVWDRVFGTGA